MIYTKKEREYYNLHREMTCRKLGITKNQYNWFRRKGEELRKLYENNCNGYYEKFAEKGISAEDIYFQAVREKEAPIRFKVKELKLYCYFQTDPRGAALYLDTEPIPKDSYTQGVCIY